MEKDDFYDELLMDSIVRGVSLVKVSVGLDEGILREKIPFNEITKCSHPPDKVTPKCLSFHIQECEFFCECGAKVRVKTDGFEAVNEVKSKEECPSKDHEWEYTNGPGIDLEMPRKCKKCGLIQERL